MYNERLLGLAVIERACDDYKKYYKAILKRQAQGKNPRISDVIELKQLKKWFLSEKFTSFAPNISGDYLIKKIEQSVREEFEGRRLDNVTQHEDNK